MPDFYPRARLDVSAWGARTARGADADVVLGDLSPSRLEVVRTPHTEPDTFRATLDLVDLRVDTRAVRDLLVHGWIADLGSLDGELSTDGKPTILGFVDRPPVRLGADGDDVSLDGRDYGGIAADEKWRRTKVRADRPLDDVVRSVLGAFPSLERLVAAVEVRIPTDENGVPTTSVPPATTATGKRGRWFRWKADGNVLEALGRLCARVGWVVFFEGDALVLAPGRGVYGGDALAETPELVVGVNVEEFSFERALTRERIEGIEVVAWNDREGRVYAGRWPKRGERDYRTHIAPPGPAWTKESAERLARETFELLRRTQITGKLSTRDMRVGGFDLTALRPGQTIRVAIDPELEEALAVAVQTGDVDLLVDAGLERDSAALLAENWIDVLAPWVVAQATQGVNQAEGGDGWRLDLDLVGAVVVDPEDLEE